MRSMPCVKPDCTLASVRGWPRALAAATPAETLSLAGGLLSVPSAEW
jgi:hypothetical protein